MRKFLSILLMVTMVVSSMVVMATPANAASNKAPVVATDPATEGEAWDGSSVSESLAGSGTEDDPYQISSANDFYRFLSVDCVGDTTGKYYVLTSNINMANNQLRDDGTRTFSGVLDGQGHYITKITVTGSGEGGAGTARLFAGTVSGTIQNMVFDSLTVSGISGPRVGLIDTLTGTISNVSVQNFTFSGRDAGVYVVTNAGTIDSCTATDGHLGGSSSNNGQTGVFAASNTGTITNCTNYASLNKTSNSLHFGAIAGHASGTAKIINCSNYGEISSGSASHVGGIVGQASGTAKIINCSNYGVISSSKQFVGGIVGLISGSANNVLLDGCVNYGVVKNTSSSDNNAWAGGLVGQAGATSGFTIQNCFNYGKIVSDSNGGGAGGLFGACSGQNYGSVANRTILYSGNYGEVESTKSHYAGGIAGTNTVPINKTLTLQNVVSTGTLSGGAGKVGSLIGKTQDRSGTTLSLSGVYAPGEMSGTCSISQMKIVVGENVYLTIGSSLSGRVTADSSPVLETADPVAFATTLNTYDQDGDEATKNTSAWFVKDGAPMNTVGSTFDKATVQINKDGSVNLLVRMDAVDGVSSVEAHYGNLAGVVATSAANTYTVSIPVNLSDVAQSLDMRVKFTIGDNAVWGKTVSVSVLDILASLYNTQDISAADKALIEAIVDYAHYYEVATHGASTVVADFNAINNGDDYAVKSMEGVSTGVDAYVGDGNTALTIADGITVTYNGDKVASANLLSLTESIVVNSVDTSVAAILQTYINAGGDLANVAAAIYNYSVAVVAAANA